MPESLIDLIQREWRAEAAGGELARRFRVWRFAHPALIPFPDPQALIRFQRGRASPARKDAVLLALLELARIDPLAGRVVLEALVPGLARLGGRILRDASEREEVWELLLACAWEQILAYPLERRPRRVAANLLLDTLRRTLRALEAEHEGRSELTGRDLDKLEAPEEIDTDTDALLAQAVAAGAISRAEADLIATTRIDGMPLRLVAEAQGAPYNRLKVRRQRAERRLLLFLGRPRVPRPALGVPFGAARDLGAMPAGRASTTNQSG